MMKIKRALGQIRGIPEDVEETRTVEFVITNETKDRHGTVLDADGWIMDSYMKNPIVGYQHDVYGDSFFQSPDPDSVIAKSRIFREGNQWIAAVTFETPDINPKAEKIFRKTLFGTLSAASVGFMPIEKGRWGQGEESVSGKNPTYYYGRRELLEFSIVNIPSNPDAIRRRFEADDLKEIIESEQEEIKDTQKPTSVPDDEKISVLFKLTKQGLKNGKFEITRHA
jgi:hypothetical protein